MGHYDRKPIQELFKESAAKQKQKPAPPPATKEFAPPVFRETSPAGTLLDERTKQARDAELKRRAGLKTNAAKPVQPSLELVAKDIEILFQGWIERAVAANTLVATEWNSQQILNMVYHQVAIGTQGWAWSTASFDAASKWLSANGYFEETAGRRHRGQNAPKEYSPFEG